MTPIHYITQWYADADPARSVELSAAVLAQAARVDSYSVLCTAATFPVEVRRIDHRPTFAELVACQRPDAINLLTNTDCWLEDVDMLHEIKDGEVWCLSRMDQSVACSQDAWAWRGSISIPPACYTQGLLGCDNRFAFDLAALGLVVTNPALSMRLHHNHASQLRHYDDSSRLPHPYLFVEPVGLGRQSRLEFRGGHSDRRKIKHLHHLLTDLKQ